MTASIREKATDLKTLDKRLRAMLGHLGRRDRDVILEACEALLELANRLHTATATGIDPGAVIDDGPKPVTAAQVDYLLNRRRSVLGELAASGHASPADTIAGEVLEEAAGHVRGLGVSRFYAETISEELAIRRQNREDLEEETRG